MPTNETVADEVVNTPLETCHMPEDVDAGGQATHGYWRTFALCQDGSYVAGIGDTKDKAETAARKRAMERNTFLSSGPRERLRAILARVPDARYLLETDIQQAIKAIAEILL